jgi:hypothetical protein
VPRQCPVTGHSAIKSQLPAPKSKGTATLITEKVDGAADTCDESNTRHCDVVIAREVARGLEICDRRDESSGIASVQPFRSSVCVNHAPDPNDRRGDDPNNRADQQNRDDVADRDADALADLAIIDLPQSRPERRKDGRETGALDIADRRLTSYRMAAAGTRHRGA